MDDAEIESGLFAIQLSDDDDENNDNGQSNSQAANKSNSSKADRTEQTEEQFQQVKRTYRVKVDNGELWKQIPLHSPSESSSSPSPITAATAKPQQQVTKPQAQSLLHAVEELYFLRRYAEGADFVRRLFGDDRNHGDSDGDGKDEEPDGTSRNSNNVTAIGRVDNDTRKTLRYYQAKCDERKSSKLAIGGEL